MPKNQSVILNADNIASDPSPYLSIYTTEQYNTERVIIMKLEISSFTLYLVGEFSHHRGHNILNKKESQHFVDIILPDLTQMQFFQTYVYTFQDMDNQQITSMKYTVITPRLRQNEHHRLLVCWSLERLVMHYKFVLLLLYCCS